MDCRKADIVDLFAEAQTLAPAAPDDLDVDPEWLRCDRRRQRDRERKQANRDAQAILDELLVRPCACGCGRHVHGRHRYTTECGERIRSERDRTRKAEQRAEALRMIREAEGIAERECPVCGVVFPVELHAPGRPREYCGIGCKALAAWRAWRARRKG